MIWTTSRLLFSASTGSRSCVALFIDYSRPFIEHFTLRFHFLNTGKKMTVHANGFASTRNAFTLGKHKVSMKLFSKNRERLCQRLREAHVPLPSIVVLQGGEDATRYDTDTGILFRQVRTVAKWLEYCSWIFQVHPCLFDRWMDWLLDWLIDRLVDRLLDLLWVHQWLASMVVRLIDWLIDWGLLTCADWFCLTLSAFGIFDWNTNLKEASYRSKRD